MMRMRAARLFFLQVQGEPAALAVLAVHADLPAEKSGELLAEVQSEPAAFASAPIHAVQLHESFEKPAFVLVSNAGPRIGHADFDAIGARVLCQLQQNAAAL